MLSSGPVLNKWGPNYNRPSGSGHRARLRQAATRAMEADDAAISVDQRLVDLVPAVMLADPAAGGAGRAPGFLVRAVLGKGVGEGLDRARPDQAAGDAVGHQALAPGRDRRDDREAGGH